MMLANPETLARRTGTCPGCRRRIGKGQAIQKVSGIGWLHSICAQRLRADEVVTRR